MIDTVQVWVATRTFQPRHGWHERSVNGVRLEGSFVRRLWRTKRDGVTLRVLLLGNGEYRIHAEASLPKLVLGHNESALRPEQIGQAANVLLDVVHREVPETAQTRAADWSLSRVDVFQDILLPEGTTATEVVRSLAPRLGKRWHVYHEPWQSSFRVVRKRDGKPVRRPGYSLAAYDKQRERGQGPGRVLRVEIRLTRLVMKREFHGFECLARLEEYARHQGGPYLAENWNALILGPAPPALGTEVARSLLLPMTLGTPGDPVAEERQAAFFRAMSRGHSEGSTGED